MEFPCGNALYSSLAIQKTRCSPQGLTICKQKAEKLLLLKGPYFNYMRGDNTYLQGGTS